MSYVSKNPRFTTTSITDSTTGSISSPPSGADKIINRNGVLYLKNSAGGETPIGSSSGGKNYLSKQSDASAAVGTVSVVAAGGNISVAGTFPNVSSAWYADAGAAAIAISSDNTLRGTSNYLTALTSFSAAGAVYVQTPAFNIDGEDLGKALAVQFDVAGNTTADDWDVVAVRYTSAGVFGALIPIAGIASTTTGTASAQVPTGTTTFRGFFITGSTASDVYSIRWRRRAGAVAIRFDNLIVGPNSVMTGTAITDWQSYTPTGSWTANTTYTGKYARVGQNLLLDILVSTSGAPTAASLTVNIPSGLVIDTAALTSFVNGLSTLGGVGVVNDSTTTAYNIQVVYSSTTAVRVLFQNNASGAQTAVNATAPITFGAGDSVNFQCSVPIVGYSSNVTMADRAVEEYASNSSTSDANDTTSFVNGVSGSTCPGALTATRKKRVRFQTPINATDVLILEFKNSSTGVFTPLAAYDNTSGVGVLQRQNTALFGIGIDQASTSVSTDVDVSFGQYAFPSGSTYGAAGTGWTTATGFWRVRKVSGGAAVGFPVGARNVIGDVSGTAVPAGYIGEKLTAASSSSFTGPTANNTYSDVTSLTVTLTPGVWNIAGSITHQFAVSGVNTTSNYGVYVSIRDAANAVIGTDLKCGISSTSSVTNIAIQSALVSVPSVVITTSTAYKISLKFNYLGGSADIGTKSLDARGDVNSGFITAVRIA